MNIDWYPYDFERKNEMFTEDGRTPISQLKSNGIISPQILMLERAKAYSTLLEELKDTINDYITKNAVVSNMGKTVVVTMPLTVFQQKASGIVKENEVVDVVTKFLSNSGWYVSNRGQALFITSYDQCDGYQNR